MVQSIMYMECVAGNATLFSSMIGESMESRVSLCF